MLAGKSALRELSVRLAGALAGDAAAAKIERDFMPGQRWTRVWWGQGASMPPIFHCLVPCLPACLPAWPPARPPPSPPAPHPPAPPPAAFPIAWPSPPMQASAFIAICMKRQGRADKVNPEWEEICSVAAAVQNMHLAATALPDVRGYWSSWNKFVRDAPEFSEWIGIDHEAGDRCLGFFVVGHSTAAASYRAARGQVEDRVQWR